MSKLWRVFWYEYSRHVFRKRFLWNLFSVPLFVLFIVVIVLIMFAMRFNSTPIGVVDKAGIIQVTRLPEGNIPFAKPVRIDIFDDETAARGALDADAIQGVYIIQADYLTTGNVTVVEKKPIGDNANDDFNALLRLNIFSSQPPEVAERLRDGLTIDVLSMDGSRQMSDQRILNLILPMVMGIVLVIIVNISGGYLLQALVEEKENRTMEIVVTSISPQQLMLGKTLAAIAIGLTQLLFWSFFVIIGFIIMTFTSAWMAGQQVDATPFILLLLIMPAAFLMVGGMMAAAGAMMTDNKEAQQAIGILSMVLFLPMMMMSVIMLNPNGPVTVFMSFFPLTSPVTLLMRSTLTDLPAWQIALSLLLLYLAAAFMVWLSGKALRVGMLQYGRKVSLREVFTGGRS